MAIEISNKFENDGVLNFKISGISLPIANGLRRTVISDLNSVVIDDIMIEKNSSFINDEIVKSRLKYIPVYIDTNNNDLDSYLIELDVSNDTNDVVVVTTKDIKVFNKNTNKYLDSTIFFPPSEFDSYIEIVSLKAKSSINLRSSLKVSDKSSYPQNPICSMAVFTASIDETKIREIFSEKFSKDSVNTGIDIIRRQLNYSEYKDYVSDTDFDFCFETTGFYSNIEIIKRALSVLIERFEVFSGDFTFLIDLNCVNINIGTESYTFGNILQHYLIEGNNNIIFNSLILGKKYNVIRLGFDKESNMYKYECIKSRVEHILEILYCIKTFFD